MSKEIELGITVGGTYLTVSGTYHPEEPTEWYDGKVKPVREGRYEIQTKDYQYDHYADWNGNDWGKTWNDKKIKPTQWRGLIEEVTPADEQAILDDIIESN
jgi:hypothetical protein